MILGMKKMKRFSRYISLLTFLYCFISTALFAQEELTVATWGGSYENAQQTALFEPFEAARDIQINTVRYAGGIDILKSDLMPDLVDMALEDAVLACDQQLLHKINIKSIVKTNIAEFKANKDFVENSLLPCGIAHLSYSTLIAYDERVFTGEKPQRIEDFFDIERFPGKRALQKNPAAVLEWALMAEGVPIDQVYDLLSTERGLRLAFRRLDSIKKDIVWWDNAKQAATLLETGKAVMASGYNGRFFNAQVNGAPITMIWDAQIIDWNVWVIPKNEKGKKDSTDKNKNIDLSYEFIRFVTQTEKMARLAEIIPYGPSRKSALKRIGLHAEKGFSMRDHLPTAKHHLARALFRDANWYANTLELRNARFWDWLNKK
ncbi:MAG: putative spermidine/putrescine transport system substrate-binding protein [Cocleimonas sp.]|jgi:putative spermidine/putrescine transport system substrate-binding protein